MKICLLFALSTIAGFAGMPTAPGPDVVRLYTVKCSPCHGPDGAGGIGASFKGKLAHRTTPDIAGVIKHGIPGTAMPASPTLPDPMVQKLAMYVQYLNKKK